MQNGFNRSKQHHGVLQYFDVLGVLDGLLIVLRFESWITGSFLKEVVKSGA